MWGRKVVGKVGDTEVVKHTPGLVEELFGGETDYTVKGKTYDTAEEAFEAAIHREKNK